MRSVFFVALAAGAALSGASGVGQGAEKAKTGFGPENPFYAASSLPFHAPPFDKIKDEDYQPAIEAGMARQLAEVRAIAGNSAAPTVENTLVPLEKSGALPDRAMQAFNGVTGANTDPTLQAAKSALAPKLAAQLRRHLPEREAVRAGVRALREARSSPDSTAESKRLVEVTYDEFVHAGARLSEADKEKLKKLNEESSTLSDTFSKRLLRRQRRRRVCRRRRRRRSPA